MAKKAPLFIYQKSLLKVSVVFDQVFLTFQDFLRMIEAIYGKIYFEGYCDFSLDF